MKTNPPQRTGSTLRGLLWAICLSLVLTTNWSSASTNFIYDAYQQAPGSGPQNPPWPVISTYVNGTDSTNASGSLFTIVKGPEFTDPGHYWQHNLTVSEISSTSEYEARVRLRLRSYGDAGGGERPLFTAVIEDGSRYLGLGASLVGNTARFFLMDGAFTPFVVTNATLSGDDFFNVVVRKTGTTGGSSDYIDLVVNGSVVDVLGGIYGGHSQNYGNLPGTSGRDVYWGAGSSITYGVTEMTGISFGINEAAPALIPEPSAVTLCLAALLIGFRKTRNRIA